MVDIQTIAAYTSRAADYANLGGAARPFPALDAFIADLPKAAHVLDLGCGPGTWAKRMIDAGHTVTAMDATQAFVDMAREKGVDARLQSFDDITGDAAYDGVWANFSLLHAPKARFAAHLMAIKRALRPGGLFHIAMKLGQNEVRDTLGRFYSYYSETELTDHLTAVGFSTRRTYHGEDAGLSGDLSNWVMVHACPI